MAKLRPENEHICDDEYWIGKLEIPLAHNHGHGVLVVRPREQMRLIPFCLKFPDTVDDIKRCWAGTAWCAAGLQ